VYFGAYDGNVYALNAATGTQLWSFATGLPVQSSPTVANGVVYIGAGTSLDALNATTGALLWSYPTSDIVKCVPAVANGVVYVIGFQIYAINATTGSLVWSGLNYVAGSPVVANGIVYVDWGGDLATEGLSAVNGRGIFISGIEAASLAVANGVIYLGTNSGNILYAEDARTANPLWNFTTNGTITSSAAVADGVVYVGSADGNIYAVNATTRAFLWTFHTGDVITSSPAVANGMVYVTSADGNLYAFNLQGGLPAKLHAPRPSTLRPDFNLKPSQPVTRLTSNVSD